MKVFTIESGKVEEGAVVEAFHLQGAGVTIPAILVGEEGRGRELGVLPVELLAASRAVWEAKGQVEVELVELGQTKSGKLKLIEVSSPSPSEDERRCIIVFRTNIGFRGYNEHSGDRSNVYWVMNIYAAWEHRRDGSQVKERYSSEEMANSGRPPSDFESRIFFSPFPGQWLVTGRIAQGAAGRAGSGEQGVALMPEGVVFRTGYSGRLYGAPSEHYYIFKDGRILSATWEERQVVDMF